MDTSRSSPVKRAVFGLGAIVVAAGLLEVGSRLVLGVLDRPAGLPPVSARDLNEYQMVHPRHPRVWTLRPGFRQSVGEAIDAKERSGRTLGARYLRERAAILGLSREDTFVRINREGFRGPEIGEPRTRPRILTIGDSCTFGTFPEERTYPRVLETELARRGVRVEVINAGVEGYSPRHVLERIEDYTALTPDVTTIYLGWNAIFSEKIAVEPEHERVPLATVRLVRRAVAALRSSERRARAREAVERPRRPDRDDPLLAVLAGYVPSCLGDIERIGDTMERAGSRIVLMTLAGLYDEDPPSPEAIAMGHLPEFTDNPYVLARMTARFNESLRALTRRKRWVLVDLDQWGKTALSPRHARFFDSVHLDDAGQSMIGAFLARSLAEKLSASP
jgi:hypothetical protein